MLKTSLRLGSALALTIAAGCTITSGDGDTDGATEGPVGSSDCSMCGESPLCHSEVVGSECVCEAGYEWANPTDPNDFDCDRIPPDPGTQCDDPNSNQQGSQCFCNEGFTWCNPSDPNDLTCCEDNPVSSTDGGSTTGDTSDPDSTGTTGDDGGEPDPADCTDEGEGGFACNNADPTDPEGSRLWQCLSGEWVEQEFPAFDEQCEFDNFDFAAGCSDDPDDPEAVQFLCEDGPGTDCTDADSACSDATTLEFCTNGRLGAADCAQLCTVDGDAEGVTYDHGECADEAGELFCFCCDFGEEGCPEG